MASEDKSAQAIDKKHASSPKNVRFADDNEEAIQGQGYGSDNGGGDSPLYEDTCIDGGVMPILKDAVEW
jgi:hypothetical protein